MIQLNFTNTKHKQLAEPMCYPSALDVDVTLLFKTGWKIIEKPPARFHKAVQAFEAALNWRSNYDMSDGEYAINGEAELENRLAFELRYNKLFGVVAFSIQS